MHLNTTKQCIKGRNLVILASGSPTRAEMLHLNDVKFIQKIPDFDEEKVKANSPKSFVYLAAKGKMETAIKEFGKENTIICADSLVGIGKQKLGKAATEEEALKRLRMQSGSEVYIITCTILHTPKLDLIDLSKASYLFDKFDEEDLLNYISSGQWRGKAGACMVEGFCKKYIKKVIGSESTAMGLSLEKILPFV